MSLTEIIEELPKLTEQERELLFLKLEDLLYPEGEVEESPEVLAAIAEGLWSSENEPTYTIEEVRAEIKTWLTESPSPTALG